VALLAVKLNAPVEKQARVTRLEAGGLILRSTSYHALLASRLVRAGT
jgi:hypothetical protein